MKKILFIGNRFPVLNVLLRDSDFTVTHVLSQKDSFLQKDLDAQHIPYTSYGTDDKERVVSTILSAEYDILVSNGCTFILPISQFQNEHRVFINVHPSYLPYLRGRHPVNGVFIRNLQFTGASVHFMDDSIDSGNIIARKKVSVSGGIDLWLLYRLSFILEAEVFQHAIIKLKKSNFTYQGYTIRSIGSYYTRKSEDMFVDLHTMSTETILGRIKSFGIPTQGVTAVIEKKTYKIYKADKITNSYLLTRYSQYKAGQILLEDQNQLLIRTIDGMIKISSFLIVG